jgi:tetratricopeptide (TPR) repeat protein
MLDLAERAAKGADTSADTDTALLRAEQALALMQDGALASYQGDNEQARRCHRRSVAFWRQLDHAPGLSIGLANLGLAEWVAGDTRKATLLLEEALSRSRTAKLPHVVAISLRNLGLIARSQGEYARARALFEQAAAQDLPAGWYRGYSTARSLSCLGRVASLQHDLQRARALLEQALQVIREARVTGQALADCLDWQAALDAQQGDFARALRLFAAADTHWQMSGAHRYAPDQAAYARDLAVVRGALDDAAYAARWAEGAAMPPEHAIRYALQEADPAASQAQ